MRKEWDLAVETTATVEKRRSRTGCLEGERGQQCRNSGE